MNSPALTPIQFAILAHGRVNNPLFNPEAVKGIHHIGEGTAKIIPVSRIQSTQATVHDASVRRLRNIPSKVPPVVESQGRGDTRRYIVHDGNHRIAAAHRNGARVIKAMVQHEFSLIGASLLGAGLHVAQNGLLKAAVGTAAGRRGLASVYQAGVRHAARGKQIHNGILGASDAIMGPEYSEIYRQGLHSTREQRQIVAASKHFDMGPDARNAAEVATGRRSKFMDNLLSRAPTQPLGSTKGKLAGTVAGGIAAAAVEPIVPAVNISRKLIGDSPMGYRMIKDRFNAGIAGKSVGGVRRFLEDYIATPSLNMVQGAGSGIAQGLKKSAPVLRTTAAMLTGTRPA